MAMHAGIKLAKGERRVLKKLMQTAKEKREYRAAVGILLRGEGHAADSVARKLGVTIKQVFVWCQKFRTGGIEALRVRKQPGRPPRAGDKAKQRIPWILKRDPQAFGYLKGRWVLRDIARQLKKEGISLHYSSVHRVLGDLGIVRKSPRLRARGSLEKDYRKREEVRRYKQVAAALLKKESLLPFKMKNG